MNLNNVNLEDLLLTALKSEIDSKELYIKLIDRTQNGLLQDKFKFLAAEEEKHKLFVEEIYKNHYPDNEIKIPDESPVPLPEIRITDETSLSTLVKQAMEAERQASEFYKLLSERFEKGSKIHNTLNYFSDMEIGHFKILEMEKQSMERFEDADVYWPMVHAGP